MPGRWLYARCWVGEDRAVPLFEQAVDWLLAHKVLLPGVTVLERFVGRVRDRAQRRLWRKLIEGLSAEQGRGQRRLAAALRSGFRMGLLKRLMWHFCPAQPYGPATQHWFTSVSGRLNDNLQRRLNCLLTVPEDAQESEFATLCKQTKRASRNHLDELLKQSLSRISRR